MRSPLELKRVWCLTPLSVVGSSSMMEGSGTLEQQLEAVKGKAAEVRARRSDLKKIEDLGAILEEHLILDNRYTEHR